MDGDWKYKPLGWLVNGLALLPFPALYLHADLLYILLYHVVRYRKRVVRKNLAESFPEKDTKELRRIEREFFRNFADYIVETVKLLHISDSEMRKRMTFSGVEIIDEALRAGRPVVCYFAHIGNWEWAPSITLWSALTPGKDAEFCQIYRPLRNKWFDALMLKIRGRFGAVSLPKRRSFLDLLRYKKGGIPTVTGFMSDQKPSHGDPVHILKFLNHPTAVITGTETVANRLDALPVYWHLTKPSRGHYHISVLPLSPSSSSSSLSSPSPSTSSLSSPSPSTSSNFPSSLSPSLSSSSSLSPASSSLPSVPEASASGSPYPLTDRYIALLEANIRENPSLWLWSHKRWKNPVEYPSRESQPEKPENQTE